VAQRVGRGIVLLFHDRGTRRGGWLAARLGRTYPRERPGTHCAGGWVGPGAGLDGRKISSPTGIRSRTVQPVVSRYTDWATRPTLMSLYSRKTKNTLLHFLDRRTNTTNKCICMCMSVKIFVDYNLKEGPTLTKALLGLKWLVIVISPWRHVSVLNKYTRQGNWIASVKVKVQVHHGTQRK